MPAEFERPGRDREIVPDMPRDGGGTREKAKAAGRDLLDLAVEKKDDLKRRASSIADDQRTDVAERASSISRALHGAANSLRENGEPQLSDWVHQAAGQVDRFVGYLDGKRADGMADDLENMARTNPTLFLGGTYLAGFALGRFLRASSPEHRGGERPDEEAGTPHSGADAERFGGTAGASRPGPDGERFERDGETAGSVTGNLGSTGWSGVGVAPGAFGAAGSTDAPSGPLDPERSARSAAYSEQPVIQTDRDLHDAPPRRDHRDSDRERDRDREV